MVRTGKKFISHKQEKARWARIKKIYGLTKERYHEILEEQQGKCFICQRTVDQIKRSRSRWLTIDHCHYTGNIRGLLCSNCNGRLLPAVNEDRCFAERLAEYLRSDRGYGKVPTSTQERDLDKINKRGKNAKKKNVL